LQYWKKTSCSKKTFLFALEYASDMLGRRGSEEEATGGAQVAAASNMVSTSPAKTYVVYSGSSDFIRFRRALLSRPYSRISRFETLVQIFEFQTGAVIRPHLNDLASTCGGGGVYSS
jgi:hypothetical protein